MHKIRGWNNLPITGYWVVSNKRDHDQDLEELMYSIEVVNGWQCQIEMIPLKADKFGFYHVLNV